LQLTKFLLKKVTTTTTTRAVICNQTQNDHDRNGISLKNRRLILLLQEFAQIVRSYNRAVRCDRSLIAPSIARTFCSRPNSIGREEWRSVLEIRFNRDVVLVAAAEFTLFIDSFVGLILETAARCGDSDGPRRTVGRPQSTGRTAPSAWRRRWRRHDAVSTGRPPTTVTNESGHVGPAGAPPAPLHLVSAIASRARCD